MIVVKDSLTWILAITLTTIGIGATLYKYSDEINAGSRENQSALNYFKPPAVMPELNFVNYKNRKLNLDSFRGKVILLNIWATWCLPCREEMPALDRLQASLGSADFEVVALAIDRGQISIIEDFYERLDLNSLAIYHDSTGGASFKLNVNGIPATYLVNREGKALGGVVGPVEWDSPEIVKKIRSHLPPV
jgi:thiol-disulfide isomerase/thioredoxin